ncbi:MAG TPA: sulfur oxidation c-type cytochrome SoxA [Ramlibacter sp.]|nr:sulfur oxidation c-type cytochrome SoxA [Ramlibacter sp.]
MKKPLLVLAVAVLLGCATPLPPDVRRSGFDEMSASLQSMQRDDTANPAMLWVQDGASLWSRAASASSQSCAGCHGDITKMRGVAVRYPAWDEKLARPVDLGTRINLCRQRHQSLPAWVRDHQGLLGLESAVAMQSRGLPIAPPGDRRLVAFRERGERLFSQRIGQLDLSCAQCHDQLAGGRLAGSPIPQGHATGYPIYRLEWQGMGSLPRRIRGCMTGIRAEPLAADSVEMVELELHLATRAMGMKLETPAVRP